MWKKMLVVVLVAGLTGAIGCGKKSPPVVGNAPVPNFTWTPANPDPKTDVTFTDTSTDKEGPLAAWAWTFTDGTPATSTKRNETVQFASGGFKKVTLRVTDSDGNVASVTKSVPVKTPGDKTPPVLDVTTFKLKGTATDNVAVKSMTAKSGGSDVLGTASGLGSANVKWETKDVAIGAPSTPGVGGPVNVVVTASDTSSNQGSVSVTVTEKGP